MAAPNNRLSAQAIIDWDGYTLKIEEPGLNGARQKIEGVLFNDLPLELRLRLSARIEVQRDAQRVALRQQQNNNIKYVVESHVNLAERVWHNGELAFNRAWKRHLSAEAGNTHTSTKTKPSAPREPTIDDQTLTRLNISRKDLKGGLDL